MSLGKLIKEKMKELNADWSGEYVDKIGKHFDMKKCESGYTVGYGGGKSLDIDHATAIKLAKECRKLGVEDKKEDDESDKKKLAAWSGGDHSSIKGRGDAQGKVDFEDDVYYWTVIGSNGKISAQGEAKSQAEAKSAVESKMRALNID